MKNYAGYNIANAHKLSKQLTATHVSIGII